MKRGQTRRKPQWMPLVRLGGCILLAVFLAVCPINWSAAGQTVAVFAAGLRQPGNAARVLENRLSSQVPVAAQPMQAPPTASTTAPTATPVTPTEAAVSAGMLSVSPAQDGTGGKIYEQKIPTGDAMQYGIAIKNRSKTTPDIRAALQAKLTMKWQKTDAPQVLIVHTHTTEEYMPYDATYYNAADRKRTQNHARNVCAAGEAVVEELNAAGIAVIHDTTVHDSPQYTGAYNRSAVTVQENLKKYPSIRVVLDLHRDAIMHDTTGLVRPTVTAPDGQKAAQMMIIVGVVSTASLPNPNCAQNLALAAQWQKALTDACPGIMRPLSTVTSRYNQHLSPGYLLVEVGSEGNTVAQAEYSAHLLGKTLAKLLQ